MEMTASLVEKTLIVNNELGLHARVATSIVRKLEPFECSVTVAKDGVEADGRSILELLLLAAPFGSEITVRADGPDSLEAVSEISRLLDNE
jgi:phosphocarrier protein HPr